MSEALRIAIRVDASSRMGGGHVMRCLTLAKGLTRRGHDVTFVSASISDFLARLVIKGGHHLARIDPVGELVSQTAQWDSAILSTADQCEDAARFTRVAGPVDWIVLDHYRLDGRWIEASLAGRSRHLVLDDLANRPWPCDILVDPTLERSAADYHRWVAADSRVLAGPLFALLRPEFGALRQGSLERRRDKAKVERLLISLGATDIGGVTARALTSLLGAGVDCRIDVVLGSGAESLEAVRAIAAADPRVRLHQDSQDMAALLAAADLAVGAPGTSSWERCCLGVPAVTLQLADNQALVSQSLGEAGATVAVGNADAIGPAVRQLMADPDALGRMVAAAAAIVDGRGERRIVEAMVGGREEGADQIRLRAAQQVDSESLWLWRNDPLMRAMAKTHEPVSWSDHSRWFGRVLRDDNVAIYMADVGDESAATVRFDAAGQSALVSINVNPAMRSRSVGKVALAGACWGYAELYPDRELVAEVRTDNVASRKIFEALGFYEEGAPVDGYLRFVLKSRGQP